MASTLFLPLKIHIHYLGLQPSSSNADFRPLTVPSSYCSIFKPTTHLQLSKRDEHHYRNIPLSPLNSRPTFPIWATTECAELIGKVDEDKTHIKEEEPFLEIISILKGLGLVSKEISLLRRKHPCLLDQSPKSLAMRTEALEILGIRDDHLIRLLKKQPSVFTVDLGPILKFVNEGIEGFDRERFHRVLFKVDPTLLLTFHAKIKLLVRHGVEESQIGNLLNKVNLKLFCERSVKDFDEVLVYLKKVKVEKEFWWLVVRHPGLLLLNVERDIIPKVMFLENLLTDEDSVNKLIWRFPRILGYTVNLLEGHVEYLKTVFSDEDLVNIVKAYPQILSLSIERKLKPRIQYLKECNLKKKEIVKLLIKRPTFLGASFDGNLSKKSVLLQEIGIEPHSYHFAQALSTVIRISYENLQSTIDLYLSYGLSYKDICIMGVKQPHVLRYSRECLKPKIHYLVNDMQFSSKVLVSFPVFLGYSLEDRIRPRHQIMSELISKGMAKKDYSIIRLLAVSDNAFIAMVLNKGMAESCIKKWLLV